MNEMKKTKFKLICDLNIYFLYSKNNNNNNVFKHKFINCFYSSDPTTIFAPKKSKKILLITYDHF